MVCIRYLMVVSLLFGCGKQDSSQSAIQSAKVDISGQVFVVTKGRENIKLALVEVAAIPEKDVIHHIKEKRKHGASQQEMLMPAFEVAKNEAFEASSKSAEAAKRASELHIAWLYNSGNEKLFNASVEADKKKRSTAPIAKAAQIKYGEQKRAFDHWDSPAYFLDNLPTPVGAGKTDADGRFTLRIPSGKYAVSATASRTVFGGTETYYWLVWLDTSSPNHSLMLSNDNLFETKCGECVQPAKFAEHPTAK